MKVIIAKEQQQRRSIPRHRDELGRYAKKDPYTKSFSPSRQIRLQKIKDSYNSYDVREGVRLSDVIMFCGLILGVLSFLAYIT